MVSKDKTRGIDKSRIIEIGIPSRPCKLVGEVNEEPF